MRTAKLAAPVGIALMLVAGAARAQQLDTNPPLPNVLILLDDSGSMERMVDGSLPESSPANTCNCNAATGSCNWNAQPQPGRFGVVQQAFTGTFANGYNCAAMPRTPGSVFASEYAINGVQPYDVNYYLPYHRPIAEDTSSTTPVACVFAPGSLPGAVTPNGVGPLGTGSGGLASAFPPGAIVNRTYGATPGAWASCSFAQYPDGAMDGARDLMRFGLMTFDQDPSPGIGVTTGTGSPNPQVLNPGAFTGQWSYFPGWNTGATCLYSGNPAGCTTPTLMAVGARNPAAPPWEGRMMTFPSTYDLTAQETNNDAIQQVMLATRPYGATPMAGMFVGAQYYFWTDPKGPQQTDPYVQGGCRNQYIILLTDGAPNLDLRGIPDPGDPSGVTQLNGCDTVGTPAGHCPFPTPETTAQTLYTATGSVQKVTTYVIGFAVSTVQGTTSNCSSLVSGGTLASVCNPPTGLVPSAYAPCCELEKIALYGGSSHAYFADTSGDLQKAIGAILADIAKNTTTRTTPAYSPVVTNVLADPTQQQTNEALYLASFNPSPGLPWSGDVVRQRYDCTWSGSGYNVTPLVQASAGDDFAVDLNSGAGPQRTFIALQPDLINGGPTVDATTTIRPYVTSGVGDGLGKYGATIFAGSAPTVIPSITPTALNVTSTTNPSQCSYYSSTGGGQKYLSATQCRDMLLDFTFAQPSFTGPPDFSFVSRSANAFGDVFHAMPVAVGPPGSLLQDAAYVGFRSAWGSRKQVVYVATNDGLLHAFWADETKIENNELWAMMPPAVMPSLLASYPSSHNFLLDGSPVVKDVVWDRALANASDPTVFHTMLVAGYGPYEQGYYAVDVTNPDPSGLPNGSVPNDPPVVGPTFRWQLTKMPAKNLPLFGAHSATPAVTTVFMNPGDGGGAREIGVAILPGGEDTGPTSTSASGPPCPRWPKTSDSAPPSGFTARTAVRCWGTTQTTNDVVVGRSVSIVRLDTGEILRVFARKNDYVGTYKGDTLLAAGRVIDTPLDSPMTGTPIVYPGDVGTDTTKFFMGDADGTLWRFDVSNSDPNQWFGELYLDLYNKTVDTSSGGWADGQPLEVTPVVSLDTAGEVVLDLATGTTESYDTNGAYVIYSITEKVQGAIPKLRANVNWYLAGPPLTTGGPLLAGERVSGPMTVFNGTFYFSTYAAAQPGAPVCTGGQGRIWGVDFVKAQDPACQTNPSSCNLALGGAWELTPPPPSSPTPLVQYIIPQATDTTLNGKVIPGVSIKATPACASLGTPGPDSYVYGATHAAPQNFTQGSYSVFTTVGAKGSTGTGPRTLDIPVQTPVSPTVIDSWAAVLE